MNSTSGGTHAQADGLTIIEDADKDAAARATPWKVLIVDDEPDVHVATKLALKEFAFNKRGIEFLDAYDGSEACQILSQHPEIAVVFLDVVMESEDSGLKVARRIREEIGNARVRIILRTGQPGQAPEEQVMLGYQINDYKLKSELTAKKLFTSLVSALRSHQELESLETRLLARKG